MLRSYKSLRSYVCVGTSINSLCRSEGKTSSTALEDLSCSWSTFLFGSSSSMRMVALEDEVKEIEIQPGLKPRSFECWLPLQVLGTECIVAGLS